METQLLKAGSLPKIVLLPAIVDTGADALALHATRTLFLSELSPAGQPMSVGRWDDDDDEDDDDDDYEDEDEDFEDEDEDEDYEDEDEDDFDDEDDDDDFDDEDEDDDY